ECSSCRVSIPEARLVSKLGRSSGGGTADTETPERSRTLDQSGFVVSKPLELRIVNDAGSPRVTVAGELDLATAEQLEAQLKQVESSGPGTLVLDLRELEFMDSTGLRAVIAA